MMVRNNGNDEDESVTLCDGGVANPVSVVGKTSELDSHDSPEGSSWDYKSQLWLESIQRAKKFGISRSVDRFSHNVRSLRWLT